MGLSTALSHLFHQCRLKMALSLRNRRVKGEMNALHTKYTETRESGSDGLVVAELELISVLKCVYGYNSTLLHTLQL